MKIISKKVVGLLLVFSILVLNFGTMIYADGSVNKTFSYSQSIFRGVYNGSSASDAYCWVESGSRRNALVQYATLENNPFSIKSAVLQVTLSSAAGWTYDSNKTYTMSVGSMKNNWDGTSATTYSSTLGVSGFILNPDLGSATSVNNCITLDITNDFKTRLANSSTVSYYIYNKTGNTFFVSNTSNAIKLVVTYYSDNELTALINQATADTIDNYIKILNSP